MKMDVRRSFVLIFAFLPAFYCLPEPGSWKDQVIPEGKDYLYFVKNMYKDTEISATIACLAKFKGTVTWELRYSPCAQEFQQFNLDKENAGQWIYGYINNPDQQLAPVLGYKTIEYIKVREEVMCEGKDGFIHLHDHSKDRPKVITIPDKAPNSTAATKKDADNSKNVTTATTPKPGSRRRRDDAAAPNDATTEAPPTKTAAVTEKTSKVVPKEGVDLNAVVKTWKSGYYLFIIRFDDMEKPSDKVKVSIDMKSSVGYISAVEWPLLIFYGLMGLVYIFYALIWLVMLACNWRDLLRIQYWICGVILLGMVEKAVFYGEYQNISTTGQSLTNGAVVIAEVVSCLKRALARMLVIIISLGFGIVKPRLGPLFNKVIFAGGLFFVLATIEGCMRSLKPKGDQSTDVMLSAVPLAIVDACILWWIFSSLVQTTRQLRMRRNLVKLSLYKHFTNTLAFAVLASIIFMIWSIIQIKTKTCLKDWRDLWVDEAFWHLLFSVILAVIMIIWRPSANSQRYAFSPLLNEDDEEEEEPGPMNDAFDGMKMRSKTSNGSPRQKEQNTIEDDLKWVEENIPASITDRAHDLLESDEEMMNTKYEMSKMQ